METSIFSAPLVRGLTDKIYDRRKAAALEIERLVRENNKAPERITAIINALVQDFVYSNNSNARYGGLIGLAASAIALGPGVAEYLDIIVPPILSCFNNQDQKVRYYACESMYNIAKVAKGEVLRFFNSIFDALCKLSADSELTVKNGAELLDRLIKDVVSELSTTYVSPHQPPLNPPETEEQLLVPTSLPRNTAFSLPRFIPLLSQRIYVRNSSARQYLVQWIGTLDSIPDLELVSFLPEFLDGLIQFLSDASEDVRVATSVLLADFLQEIRQAAAVREQQQQLNFRRFLKTKATTEAQEESETPSEEQPHPKLTSDKMVTDDDPEADVESTASIQPEDDLGSDNDGHGKGNYMPGQGVIVKYDRIVEILVPHLSSSEEDIQRTALQWINEFIAIAKDVIIKYTPEIINAVLPSLAHPVDAIRMFALEVNQNLQNLVFESSNTYPEPMASVSDPSGRPSQMKLPPNVSPSVLARSYRSNLTESNNEDPFDYQTTVANLRLQFLNEHEETRVASLDWLLMLHKKAPNKILASDDGTFPALLKTLSDPSEEVVRRDLQLLAQISSHSDHNYFRSFMMNLLLLFSTDRRLLETRGSLIIRQLGMSLDPERIYCTIADILENDEDLEFASIMVQNLNIILITSSELADLRKRLRNLDHKDGQRLFITLYKSWCHNAVATFSLCLLAQAYEHAATMLQVFAELDITVNMLIQIDKLVQLLESPVFTYLRLQLLEPDRYPHLFKCLYGILMLLPQSSAFSTLRNRLSSVSSLGFLHVIPKSPTIAETPKPRQTAKSATATKPAEENLIKFQELLQHFKSVQARHEKQRKQALQNVSRNNTSKNRRPRLVYGTSGGSSIASNGSSAPNQTSHRDEVSKGGLRNAMNNLTLGNGHERSTSPNHPSRGTSASSPATRMIGRKSRKP